MPRNPKTMGRWDNTLLAFGCSLHGRIEAKHAPTQGRFRFVYVALVHRPSSPPVAERFAAIVVTLHESGGKPRGKAQGFTAISVGRKAANGVPGYPRAHTLATPRYSALYRQPNARQKVRPTFEGPDFLVGRENVFAQSAPQGRQRGHVFILAGGM